jgi:hypothetical protein
LPFGIGVAARRAVILEKSVFIGFLVGFSGGRSYCTDSFLQVRLPDSIDKLLIKDGLGCPSKVGPRRRKY